MPPARSSIPCRRCGSLRSDVVDSRGARNGTIRRRRRCADCGERFTTYESLEAPPGELCKTPHITPEIVKKLCKLGADPERLAELLEVKMQYVQLALQDGNSGGD